MEYLSVVILGVASYIGTEFIGKPIKALPETVSAISGCLIYYGNASSLNDKKAEEARWRCRELASAFVAQTNSISSTALFT
jgi:hypothetical protein